MPKHPHLELISRADGGLVILRAYCRTANYYETFPQMF